MRREPGDRDEKRVRTALERRLRQDKACRSLTRAVRLAQAALRRAVTDDVWQLYLAVEERTNARHDEIVGAAIRIASRTRR